MPYVSKATLSLLILSRNLGRIITLRQAQTQVGPIPGWDFIFVVVLFYSLRLVYSVFVFAVVVV